jgi:hypothetical protein
MVSWRAALKADDDDRPDEERADTSANPRVNTARVGERPAVREGPRTKGTLARFLRLANGPHPPRRQRPTPPLRAVAKIDASYSSDDEDDEDHDDPLQPLNLGWLLSTTRHAFSACAMWTIFGMALLALSIIFDIVYPFEEEPEMLFYKSREVLYAVQGYSNLGFDSLNVGMTVLQPVIPLWNSVTNYVVEPMVFIMTEVVATVVTGNRDFFFFLSDDDETYNGYECFATNMSGVPPLTEDAANNPLLNTDAQVPTPLKQHEMDEMLRVAKSSQAWCGLYTYYAAGITGVEKAHWMKRSEDEADYAKQASTYKTESAFNRARRLRDATGRIVALPRGVARRMSEKLGVPVFPVAVFDDIANIAAKLVGFIVSLFGMVADLVMHVLFLLFDEVVDVVVPIIIDIIKILFQLIYQLIISGFLGEILRMALDLIVILAFDIAVPMLMATIDAIKCIFRLFDYETFGKELRCIATHCFRPGEDSAVDLLVFTSAPIIMEEIYKVVTDTYNGARRMFGLGAADLSSTWLNQAETWYTNHTSVCASCFECKVGASPHPHTPCQCQVSFSSSPPLPLLSVCHGVIGGSPPIRSPSCASSTGP